LDVKMARDRPSGQGERSATELARDMRERNAQSRERVLRSIARLREIAEAKRRRR
jgi:hypothetical protein